MGTYTVTVESKDKEVIKGMKDFVKRVTAQGKGVVYGDYKMVSKTKIELHLTYQALGFIIFKKVVFNELKKTVMRKDKDAKVEILEEKQEAKGLRGILSRLKG